MFSNSCVDLSLLAVHSLALVRPRYTTFPLYNRSRFTQGLSYVASEAFGRYSRDPAAAHQNASLFHCFLDLKIAGMLRHVENRL